jgi:hypothetical protein
MNKENKYVDKHHASHNPLKTFVISHKEHQIIHGLVPIVTPLNLKMRQYDYLTKLSAMTKNWEYSYRREFEDNPVYIGLDALEQKKKMLLKEVRTLIQEDLQKVQHIKGLGIRYLAGLLAYAHPQRFRSLHRYLYYCGYTKASRITWKYNRKVCGLVHQTVISIIRSKDSRYYPLYLKLKKELASKYPLYSKWRIDRMAKNRVGTVLLKELFCIFRKEE